MGIILKCKFKEVDLAFGRSLLICNVHRVQLVFPPNINVMFVIYSHFMKQIAKIYIYSLGV